MSILNKQLADNIDYSNWTDEDFVNDFIMYLYDNHGTPIAFGQIPSIQTLKDNRKRIIQAMVVTTGLVINKPFGYFQQFQLYEDSLLLVKKHGSYLNYLKFTEGKEKQHSEQSKSIEGLQIEELVLKVNKLRSEFSDYNETKTNARWAIRLSAATIIVTIVLQIIEWKCKGKF